MKPSLIFHQLCDQLGQKSVGIKLGLDDSQVSRIRTGDLGIKLDKIDKLFDVADVVVLTKEDYVKEQQDHMIKERKYEDVIETLSELWRESRFRQSRLKDNGNGKGK